MSGPDPFRVGSAGLADDFGEWRALNWAIESFDGDSRKIPKRPANPARNAKSNDGSTWGPYDDALRNACENDDLGFGFPCAQSGHPFVFLDVDIPDGDEWVPSFDLLGGAVIERSPSGSSRRVVLLGCEVPEWWTNQSEKTDADETREVKIFDDTGYVTLTGDTTDGFGTPLESTHSPAFEQWLKEAWFTFNDSDDHESKPWENPETEEDSSGEYSRSNALETGSKNGEEWINADTARDALRYIDPDLPNDDWVQIGFALGGHFPTNTAEQLFEEWSRRGTKWDAEAERRISSIIGAADGTVGISTLVHYAKEGGWDASAAARANTTSTPTASDGGTAAAPSPDTVGSHVLALNPENIGVMAGLGEDDNVSDLNDRQMAACVWDLVRQSDDYHIRVRRDNGTLWSYDTERGVWTNEGERALRHAARQALGSMNYGANILAELKAQARSDPVAEVEADEFGVETGTVAVENGLLDIESAADCEDMDAIRPLHPDDLALTCLPVEYDPTADVAEWAEYVTEWAEDGKADALQEYVGYCLEVGAMPIHRAVLMVGSGANGKGTFLKVVRELLGEENTTSIELQTLANEKDAVADFYGALANIDDDLSSRSLGRGLGMFKKLTAGDPVRARRLYEDGFQFRATGKHLYAANEVPEVEVPEGDDAFWRRWLLVEFPNHYAKGERDPELADRLTEPGVLSGVLNWAIEGHRRLLDQGYFTNEAEYGQQKRERWQSWGESVDKFIAECTERDPDANRITTGDAHRRYAAWCRENNEDPIGQQEFTRKMKTEDFEYGTSVRINGKVQRGYKTLGVTEDVPALEETPERGGDEDHQQRRDSDLSSY